MSARAARPAWLQLTDEVETAVGEGRPVVALESSLLAQGLPPPDNIQTARSAEAAVRQAGAVPATTAMDGGRLIVGADEALLERLADPRTPVAKAASRDIGPLLAAGGMASTTVSATMRAAYLAGVSVFATGGIGGVHRAPAGAPADVSSDIDELGTTPVAVVCSGAKSILDLPATLELLETRRVPVIGIGTDELPAFYSATSRLRLVHRADSPGLAARIVALHFSVPGAGGALLVQPPPAEVAIPAAEVDAWVDAALADAEGAGVTGGRLTPFLLAAIAAASGGRTLRANTALIVNNARTAARIAVALAERADPRRG